MACNYTLKVMMTEVKMEPTEILHDPGQIFSSVDHDIARCHIAQGSRQSHKKWKSSYLIRSKSFLKYIFYTFKQIYNLYM